MTFVEEYGMVFMSYGGFKQTLGLTTRGKILLHKFSEKECGSEPIELKIISSRDTLSLVCVRA